MTPPPGVLGMGVTTITRGKIPKKLVTLFVPAATGSARAPLGPKYHNRTLLSVVKVAKYFSVLVFQCYSRTVLQCNSCIALQYYCVTAAKYYSVIVV